MIYFDTTNGWTNALQSWLDDLPDAILSHRQRIHDLSTWLIARAVKLVRCECTTYTLCNETMMAHALFSLLRSLMDELTNKIIVSNFGEHDVGVMVECLFLFSLVWSVGGCLDTDGRKRFSDYLRLECESRTAYQLSAAAHFPRSFDEMPSLVYDYTYDIPSQQWRHWNQMLPNFRIPRESHFTDILVPTIDTVRTHSLIESLIKTNKSVLVVGSTGVGKSVIINHLLRQLPTNFTSASIQFSAHTSADATQSMMEATLQRTDRRVYAPADDKQCVIFLDDLNQPMMDEFGSQMTNELIRFLMDRNGAYDHTNKTFHRVERVAFVGAMGLTGGGRHQLTDQALRHFNHISLIPFDPTTIRHIFTTILTWHFESNAFIPSVHSLQSPLISATCELYDLVTSQLLPTPSKSHYTYNLRDISRVFAGLLMAPSQHFKSAEPFVRLWVHEVHRVFCDRLVNDDDSQLFLGWVQALTVKHFKADFHELMQHLDEDGDGKFTAEEVRSLFFGEYMSQRQPRHYVEITELGKLQNVWADYLDEYNAQSNKPMHLTLFRFAIEHLSRISRILKQAQGHALLVGVGGSGKQSLTRLAAFMLKYSIFDINLTNQYSRDDWARDLRCVLRESGGLNKPTILLLNDHHLANDSFLEDINSLLTASTVNDLWPLEDQMAMMELVRDDAKRANKYGNGEVEKVFGFFTDRVRRNLHIVLCMSPTGNILRDRLRHFPSLQTHCYIDWFTSWPRDALWNVARDTLTDMDDHIAVKQAAMELCLLCHQDVSQMAEDYYRETHRHTYVTPTSYLELLTTFKTILSYRRRDNVKLRAKYRRGIDQLESTEAIVASMQSELDEIAPILQTTSEALERMEKVLATELSETARFADATAAEQLRVNGANEQAASIESECESQLLDIVPIVQQSSAALENLNYNEISELKALRNPPRSVKLVMEALCILKQIPSARIKDPSGSGKMIEDYWEPAKKHILSDVKLLRSLVDYEKDDINPALMKKVRAYIAMPDFEPNKVKSVSLAAYHVCMWIISIEQYDRVIKVIGPKRAVLNESRSTVQTLLTQLQSSQTDLTQSQSRVDALTAQMKSSQADRAILEAKINNVTLRITRANKVMSKLVHDKAKWQEVETRLTDEYAQLVGNVLLAAATIAYLGPYSASYRAAAVKRWSLQCAAMNIPCSPSFDLGAVLGDPIAIRRWLIEGLPNDSFFVDNAIIMSKSRRWPLMIDPQNAAADWIKRMEKDNKLIVLSAKQDYHQQLHHAMQLGLPVIIQHCTERLDYLLEPLLLKQIYSKGATKMISFTTGDVEYADSFRLYLATNMPNPHYLPETAVNVQLLNFTMGADGLSSLFLNVLLATERSDLESERLKVTVNSVGYTSRLKDLEEKVLSSLAESEGSVLDNEKAIDTIVSAKGLSADIEERQSRANTVQADVQIIRSTYESVAAYAAVLFFAVTDLSLIDPMYQFSLPTFLRWFQSALIQTRNAEADVVEEIKRNLTSTIYHRIAAALFVDHRAFFAALIILRTKRQNQTLTRREWNFLLTMKDSDCEVTIQPNPSSSWLDDSVWTSLHVLAAISAPFSDLISHWKSSESEWRIVMECDDITRIVFPSRWANVMSEVHRLLFVRAARPNQFVRAVSALVRNELGDSFNDSVAYDLSLCLADHRADVPAVLLLKADSDAAESIYKVAKARGMLERLYNVSLGRGQESVAAALIHEAQKDGSWVILHNAHLSLDWIHRLHSDLEAASAGCHVDFRLFITSMSVPAFSSDLLHRSIIIAADSPLETIRSSVIAAYHLSPIDLSDDFYDVPIKGDELRMMSVAIAFLHAVISSRELYGELGWMSNVSDSYDSDNATAYSFDRADRTMALRSLQSFIVTSASTVPFDTLANIIFECVYGARMHDEWDRRILRQIIRHYITPNAVTKGFVLALDGDSEYQTPDVDDLPTIATTIDALNRLPPTASSTVSGVSRSGMRCRWRVSSRRLLQWIRMTAESVVDSVAVVGSAGAHDQVLLTASRWLKSLPAPFVLSEVERSHPAEYKRPLNQLLLRECADYNGLLAVVEESLSTVVSAINGAVVMSIESEQVAAAIYDNRIPQRWRHVCYASNLDLEDLMADLSKRVTFIHQIIRAEVDIARSVWIGAFFSPTAYLTALRLTFARSNDVAVESVVVSASVVTEGDVGLVDISSSDAVYLRGLYFVGAEWDSENNSLRESNRETAYSPAPPLLIRSTVSDFASTILSPSRSTAAYECPLFTTCRSDTSASAALLAVRIAVADATTHAEWIQRAVKLVVTPNR